MLVAHGGQEASVALPSAFHGPAVRMYPFSADLARAGWRAGLLVAQLRYRVRGYNAGDPVRDIEWGIERLAARAPGAPICLLGHSMGARASLRAAGHPAVAAVAALAPWTPHGEPVGQLAGRDVLIAHGDADRRIDPASSRRYAVEAAPVARRLARFEVVGGDHALLARAALWHALTRGFVLAALGLAPPDRRLADALALPPERRIAIPV